MTLNSRTVLGAVALTVVGAVVAGGLWVVGSPGEARAERLDMRRVEDLRSAASAIDLQWNRTKVLPASIDEATRARGSSEVLRDPVSGQPYEYRAVDARRYELCATFERASDHVPAWGDPIWAHVAGRQCFALEAKEFKR